MKDRTLLCLAITLLCILALGCGTEETEENTNQPENQNQSEQLTELRVTINDGPQDLTDESAATFSFECNRDEECQYRCQINDGNWRSCDSGITYEDLLQGEHLFTIEATDEHGETSEPATWRWTVDFPPSVTNLEGPDAFTDSTEVTFSFGCSEEGCTFVCRLNEGDFESCESGVTYTGLTDGEYRFEVQPSSALGTAGSARDYAFEVNTTAPTVLILDGPSSPTNSQVATFDFDCSVDNCSFSCRIEDDDPHDCDSGVAYEDLQDGTHTFGVTATDPLGRHSDEETWQWTVDTETPEVTDLQGPATLTNQQDATFSFGCSKTDCHFSCELQSDSSADEVSCESGITLEDLADGEHLFSVTATDEAGNPSDAATWEWTIDTELPQVEILNAPPALTNQTEATLSLECSKSDCALSCELSGPSHGGTLDCDDGEISLDELADGAYQLDVVAEDQAGNQSETTSATWTVDTEAPQVEQLTGPPALTNETTATIDFQCSKDDCEFSCALFANDEPSSTQSCAPGEEFSALDDGDYTLEVVATDEAGNTGDPATLSWTIDTVPPVIAILQAPPESDNRIKAFIEFECVDKSCEFECAADFADDQGTEISGDFDECTDAFEIDTSDDGDYAVHLRATDLAGNTSTTTIEWTVELAGFVQFDMGAQHACGVATDTTLWCWGNNGNGALGINASTGIAYETPQQVSAGSETEGWAQVSAGNSVTCAIRDDSSLWCWGENSWGAVGDGSSTNRFTPVPIIPDTELEFGWALVSTKGSSTCAIRDDSTLWCWGNNRNGTVGIGSNADEYRTPQQVGQSSTIETGWTDVRAGSCALREDSSLWCWGANDEGQLGLGDTIVRTAPQRVGLSTDLATGWAALEDGHGPTRCGVRQDNTLYCWGQNDDGQVGDGTTTRHTSPVQVGLDTELENGWESVATGSHHTCALRLDGTVACWGRNSSGELARGITSDRETTPEVIQQSGATPSDLHGIRSFNFGSCAHRLDLSLSCWGFNAHHIMGFTGSGAYPNPVNFTFTP